MAGAVIGARLGPVGAIAGTVIGGLIGFALSDD
jgi:phage tail tape-measure protein